MVAVTLMAWGFAVFATVTRIGEATPGVMNGGSTRTVSAAVTVKPVNGEPTPGSLKVTMNSVGEFMTTEVITGAPGSGTGVTLLDAAEAGPVPMALVAVTVKV